MIYRLSTTEWDVQYEKHTLQFAFEAGTSRGVLTEKDTYFVRVSRRMQPHVVGIGECSPLKGLSIDDLPNYEIFLNEICDSLPQTGPHAYAWDTQEILRELIGNEFPSIQFGFETALLDLQHGGKRVIFPGPFVANGAGIAINGLIWMGSETFMRQQIEEKLAQGFRCIKLKIGSLDFDRECALLDSIRRRYPADQITLRVDANGAFAPHEAMEKLTALAAFDLHSVEQPIRSGQWETMADLCRRTPLPIALDEELIGTMEFIHKRKLLRYIRPQYIILKPSLLGGFAHCREWIQLAGELRIGWWMTSALESNIGLNAISQFTAATGNPLPQGLGTGQLYTNNIPSPLVVRNGSLYYDTTLGWGMR